MDSQQTFSVLLERLQYRESPNLVLSGEAIPDELEISWRDIKEKLNIDAIYFAVNTPIIYFKCFDKFDEKAIAEFHQRVWNQSQTPLLFAIFPNEIRVYNGYEAPKKSKLTSTMEPDRLDKRVGSSADSLWSRLENFSRLAIDSGSFWRDYGQLFRRETRADQTLIANLRYVRRRLISEGQLSPEHAHSLIGRSIFAFYLQDRGVLPQGDEGFFATTFGASFKRYTDLLTSYEITYKFFDILREHFNGDMFPITEDEIREVNADHLIMLHGLFTTDMQRGGQMLFFWAYNFEFIPIELISAIYEEFLHQEESGKNGAYYTPTMLVGFMLNQVLPWKDENYRLRILDPSCGSGIFLVEAYRRLIERWRKTHGKQPDPQELSTILTTSIFGIDIKRQALRVAAFSLYLALLDHLEPKTIWREVSFPTLIGSNLIHADFFVEKINLQLGLNSFDIIVGNPPWESQLTIEAQQFLDANQYRVSDKQIAQAFLRRAPQFCQLKGQIALLCSSKSFLFNKSTTNIAFRKSFFKDFTVQKIFDFSAIRRFLFEKAIAPAVAVFYTLEKPSPEATIFYGAPKLTQLTRRFASIVIEANDIKHIPNWQIIANLNTVKTRQKSPIQESFFDEEETNNKYINIWKIALWGTNHDYSLLEDLTQYPTIVEVADQLNWFGPHGGFNRSGPGKLKSFPWLDNSLYLSGDDFTLYGIDTSILEILPEGQKYYRGGHPKLFKAPFVLFKRGQVQRRPGAAFSDTDFAYTTSITGIAGPAKDSNLLKALTALLNSDFAQYYCFLTGSSWGVEREEVTVGEMKTLPFPFLNMEDFKLQQIADLVDTLAANFKKRPTHGKDYVSDLFHPYEALDETNENLERELNYLIYQCFGLSDSDIKLIDETVKYTISFFNSPEKSISLQRPTRDVQRNYAQTFIDTLNFYLEPIGRKLTAEIFIDDKLPMHVVQFTSRSSQEDASAIQLANANSYIHKTVPNLATLAIEKLPGNLYYRRNFRVYEDRVTFSLLKPAEARLWTTGAALVDANETIAELLQ